MRPGHGGWGREGALEKMGVSSPHTPWSWPHPVSLQQLEHSLAALHLSSFGLMDTTLEEVFLKVSEEDQSLENSEAGKRAQGWRSVQSAHRRAWGHCFSSVSGCWVSIGLWWMVC